MRSLRERAAKSLKYSRAIGVLVACAVALVVAFPAPAQAAVGTQPLWRDFPQLEQNLYWNSNLVKLWQLIVQSDVDTGETCAQFVDGQFGRTRKRGPRTGRAPSRLASMARSAPRPGAPRRATFDMTTRTSWTTCAAVWREVVVLLLLLSGKRSSFYIAFGAIDHYAYGAYSYTSYDPWEFQACGQPYWITVSW